MPEITLRQLQYFVATVDHGSVTAAAEASHVSQAAASMAIAQLEKALGADLFVRSRSRGGGAAAGGGGVGAPPPGGPGRGGGGPRPRGSSSRATRAASSTGWGRPASSSPRR
jgi:hypothetical protein